MTEASERPSLLLLCSAIPDSLGSPDQRQAAALRELLDAFGAVSTIVVDLDGRQHESRAALDTATWLLPHSLPARRTAPLAQLPRSKAPRPFGHARLGSGWMSASRQDSLAAAMRAMRPDVLVVADPMLGFLATGAGGQTRTVLIDTAADVLYLALSHVAPDAGARAIHGRIAEELRARGSSPRPEADAVLTAGLPPGGPARTNHRRVPQPSLGRPDPRLFEKNGRIVVPATGLAWADHAFRTRLARAFDAVPGLAEAEWTLVGFDGRSEPCPARPLGSMMRWSGLPHVVGQASCLLVPFVTPGLAEPIQAALSVGTPVFCRRNAAAALGIEGLPGVLGYDPDVDLDTVFRLAAEHASRWLGPPPATVAAASERASGEAACLTAWEALLSDLLRRPVASRASGRPDRKTRLSAMARPPVALWSEGARLLLVEIALRGRVRVSEILVENAAGVELVRIVPNELTKTARVQVVEGGVVLARDRALGDMRLRFFRGEGEIERATIAHSDIVTLDAEIASLAVRGVFLEGVLWARRDASGAGWMLEQGGHRRRADAGKGVSLADLDVEAVPFRIPLQRSLAHDATLRIVRDAGRDGPANALPVRQRTARLSPPVLGHGRRSEVARLRDIQRGRRAWMVGNGPSVRIADLDAIPSEDVVFAFNRFYQSYPQTRLREDYVVSADLLMLEDFGQEMIDRSAGLPLFCQPGGSLRGPHVVLTTSGTYLPIFSHDIADFVSVGGSSVFVALQAAFFMGIREVVLYGMDFHFTMRMRRDPRYPFPVSFDDDNHFIKGYRSAKPWVPPNWRDIASGFLNARAVYEVAGGRIRNATRGGRLEIFPRIDFDDV